MTWVTGKNISHQGSWPGQMSGKGYQVNKGAQNTTKSETCAWPVCTIRTIGVPGKRHARAVIRQESERPLPQSPGELDTASSLSLQSLPHCSCVATLCKEGSPRPLPCPALAPRAPRRRPALRPGPSSSAVAVLARRAAACGPPDEALDEQCGRVDVGVQAEAVAVELGLRGGEGGRGWQRTAGVSSGRGRGVGVEGG
jgi:hypothetical protein